MDFDEFERLAEPLRAMAASVAADYGLQLIEGRTASADEIAQAERELGVTLPEQYKKFMMRYGGGELVYLDLLPIHAGRSGTDVHDIVSVSRREFPDGSFVALAPVGTGDFWCFAVADGQCQDNVWFHYHDGGDPTPDAVDFLAFVARRGLQQAEGSAFTSSTATVDRPPQSCVAELLSTVHQGGSDGPHQRARAVTKAAVATRRTGSTAPQISTLPTRVRPRTTNKTRLPGHRE